MIVRREPLVEKTCPVCRRVFKGLSRQRYCSRSCQKRADYQRHADRRREDARERYQRDKQQGGGGPNAQEKGG